MDVFSQSCNTFWFTTYNKQFPISKWLDVILWFRVSGALNDLHAGATGSAEALSNCFFVVVNLQTFQPIFTIKANPFRENSSCWMLSGSWAAYCSIPNNRQEAQSNHFFATDRFPIFSRICTGKLSDSKKRGKYGSERDFSGQKLRVSERLNRCFGHNKSPGACQKYQ